MALALNILMMVVIGEELFILLSMHLIHVGLMVQRGTAILYLMEQPYLMEAQFQMEPIWSYLH
jgi:hypothetical protein